MSKLARRHCAPCEGGIPALGRDAIDAHLAQLDPAWRLVEGRRIERAFGFSDFAGAMRFGNEVAELAEREQHHPDLLVRWGSLGVALWTHAVGGLSENDFVLAARIDELWSARR